MEVLQSLGICLPNCFNMSIFNGIGSSFEVMCCEEPVICQNYYVSHQKKSDGDF